MKPLSLFIIALLFAAACVYGQEVNVDTLCHLDSLPSIYFDGISKKLDAKAKANLDSVAALLNSNKGCVVTVGLWVEGDWHGGKGTNYLMLSWNRTKAIVDYLRKKNIDESRLLFANHNDDSLNDIKIIPSSKKDIPIHPQLRGQSTSKFSQIDKLLLFNILKDSDGDGIIDQFDLEPGTPHNAEVDTHGRTVDTDGDGVPDYKDKEKLTQTECFPVNKDGIGVCPEPSCCSPDYIIQGIIDVCKLPYIPPVIFSNSSPQLTKEATRLLDSAAGILRNFPNCSVEIIPYYSVLEGGSRLQLQLCWDEVYTIISYLEKAGIGKSRLSFGVSQAGNTNSVVLSASIEARRYLLPPYPPLSQIKNLPLREVEVEYRSSQQLQH